MTTTTTMHVQEWTRERVDLVKRTVCPAGITDDELALFVEQCKRTGLDPLTKQAFCVPRKSKVNGQWVETHAFQPAEAGMLARADDFPDYRGTTSGAVHENDKITIDPGAGTVSHAFSPVKRGALLGAWARVEREGRTAVVRWLASADYVQTYDGKPTGQWATRSATMIQKCAKVAALRDAFPRVFGGVYIAEEMPDDARPALPAPVSETRALPAPAAGVVQPPQRQATPPPVAVVPVVADGEAIPGDDVPEPVRVAWWQQKFADRDVGATAKLLAEQWPAKADDVRRAYWTSRFAECTAETFADVARMMATVEPVASSLRTDGFCAFVARAARTRLGLAPKGGA